MIFFHLDHPRYTSYNFFKQWCYPIHWSKLSNKLILIYQVKQAPTKGLLKAGLDWPVKKAGDDDDDGDDDVDDDDDDEEDDLVGDV